MSSNDQEKPQATKKAVHRAVPPQQQQQQQQLDKQPGDDACTSCTGVLYYSNNLRKEGKGPVCIGARKMMKYRVTDETMQKMDERQLRKISEDYYLCTGYSRVTGRMARKGQTPVCVNGMVFVKYPAEALEKKRQEKLAQEKAHMKEQLGVAKPTAAAAEHTAARDDSLPTPISKLLVDGATRQFTAAGRFWQRGFTDLPNKLEKSMEREATNMAMTPMRVGKVVQKLCAMVFGDDQDS